jgi:putative sigma-54 modulation protein
MLTIVLKGTQLDLTPALKAYAEEKLQTADKFLSSYDDVRAEVELEHTTRHHQSGPIFRAEITLHAAGLNLRAEALDEDLYAAIDRIRDEIVEEIRRSKTKEETLIRRGGRMFKDVIKRMGWGE